MAFILLKIFPVILIFILGYFLKKGKLLSKENADLFLKMNYYIALPSLLLVTVTNIKLDFEFVYLPIIAILVVLLIFCVSWFVGKKVFNLENKTLGVFLVGTMIMNMGIVYPFIIAAYGNEGIVRASLFDLGNGLMAYTFVYYFACRYGSNKSNSRVMIKKFLLSMPLVALFLGIVLNLLSLKLPSFLNESFSILGAMVIPLIMLSLGIYFTPKLIKLKPLISGLVIRMGLGLVLGLIFVKIFNFDQLTSLVVLISSAAPIGYNTLTFSALENLDKEFAASLVSASIFLGIIYIPLLMLIFS
ncbi:MAG: AEC family transporter [Candidatus Woesearchaeota archaeon]|nr:MAG: AEC family transporter [Candidatus Woesearchaeota archaeon]